MRFTRTWAMPNHETFSIPPIREFVKRYLSTSVVSVDPFARNKRWATYTNDLDPTTAAEHHMEAGDFVKFLSAKRVRADLVLFDPPYSPRQISECYKGIGREVGMEDTQGGALYSRTRDAIAEICAPRAIVLSFGWNSVGMGRRHGFEPIELLLCCHGGAHNDTICMAERRSINLFDPAS